MEVKLKEEFKFASKKVELIDEEREWEDFTDILNERLSDYEIDTEGGVLLLWELSEKYSLDIITSLFLNLENGIVWNSETLAAFSKCVVLFEPEYLPDVDVTLSNFLHSMLSSQGELNDNLLSKFFGHLFGIPAKFIAIFIFDFISDEKWNLFRVRRFIRYCNQNWNLFERLEEDGETSLFLINLLIQLQRIFLKFNNNYKNNNNNNNNNNYCTNNNKLNNKNNNEDCDKKDNDEININDNIMELSDEINNNHNNNNNNDNNNNNNNDNNNDNENVNKEVNITNNKEEKEEEKEWEESAENAELFAKMIFVEFLEEYSNPLLNFVISPFLQFLISKQTKEE